MSFRKVAVSDIRIVKELYPRIKEDNEAIARYRDAIDQLPPVVVTNKNILVDGYHRIQAHKLEKIDEITVEDIGDLSEPEIFNEAIRRNASHGQQLSRSDKQAIAKKLWKTLVHLGDGRKQEIKKLLAISESSVERFTKDARDEEKEEQEAKALDLWLDCHTQEEIAEAVGVTHQTIANWIANFRQLKEFCKPPESRQHFDVWNFTIPKDESTGYFGQMPPQVIENLLWLYTEPGDIVFDPFVGAGTTIRIGKSMGRRVWASDRKIHNDLLPIHQHDFVHDGWPKDYKLTKDKPKLFILDPPYWIQAAGKYSSDPEDMGNMSLDDFLKSWEKVVKTCKERVVDGGYVAYVVSPAEFKKEDRVVDLAWLMGDAFRKVGLKEPHRRIIVCYSTQQATGQQVDWARENKKLLKLYRDLVVFKT